MITLQGAAGAAFNMLGKAGLVVKQARTYQTSQQPNLINNTTGLIGQLLAQPDIAALIGNAYQGILAGPESACTLSANAALTYWNRLVFLDNPQPNQSLNQINALATLAYMIQQMTTQGQTILQMTVSATPQTSSSPGPSFSGVGTGVLTASAKRPFDGRVLENSFAETQTLTCVADSYTGGATAGNEQFSYTAGSAVTDPFAFNWPAGSGTNTTLNAIDGNQSNASGNLFTNSNWATFSGGVPTQWVFTAGSSLVSQETGLIYDGTSALKITGDGSTLLSFNQPFNNGTTGTSAALTAQQQYSVNMFMRRGGAAIGAGQLVFELVDQNGNVINDQNSVANTFTVNLTGLGTSYVAYNGIYRTPEIMPTNQFFRIRMPSGNALSNGSVVYLAKLSIGIMTQSALHCPWGAIHAGNVPFEQGDTGSIVVTNSRGSGGTLSTFQTLLYQLFYQYYQGNEIIFPSAASPILNDTLIG